MPARTTGLILLALVVAMLAAGCYPNPAPPNLTPIPTLAPAPTLALLEAATSLPTSQAQAANAAPAAGGTPQAAAAPAAGDAGAGKTVFTSNCVACHGANAEGGVGPKLIGVSTRLSAQQILDTVANGRKGTAMPAWSQSKGGKLTDAQIADVVAYLGTLK